MADFYEPINFGSSCPASLVEGRSPRPVQSAARIVLDVCGIRVPIIREHGRHCSERFKPCLDLQSINYLEFRCIVFAPSPSSLL